MLSHHSVPTNPGSLCMAPTSLGVEELQRRMGTMRQYILEQIQGLRQQQEATMQAQQRLGEQLGEVGRDVEGTRHDVGQVGGRWGAGWLTNFGQAEETHR